MLLKTTIIHGGDTMHKMRKRALKILSNAALANARKEANSACILFGYQPKMPKDLKQRVKRNK